MAVYCPFCGKPVMGGQVPSVTEPEPVSDSKQPAVPLDDDDELTAVIPLAGLSDMAAASPRGVTRVEQPFQPVSAYSQSATAVTCTSQPPAPGYAESRPVPSLTPDYNQPSQPILTYSQPLPSSSRPPAPGYVKAPEASGYSQAMFLSTDSSSPQASPRVTTGAPAPPSGVPSPTFETVRKSEGHGVIPATNASAQTWKSAFALEQTTAATEPMRWYYFLIYFFCWAQCVFGILNAVTYITYIPTYYSWLEVVSPFSRICDIAAGVISLAFAGYAVFVRFRLSGFKKDALFHTPLLNVVAAVPTLLSTLGIGLGNLSASGIGYMVGTIVGAACWYVLNSIYFKKRAGLFVNL